MVDIKKYYYLFLLLTNIQTLKIREANPDFYFWDKKVQYISLNKLIEIGVLAAQNNQLKSTLETFKELFKQILRHYIKKKIITLY